MKTKHTTALDKNIRYCQNTDEITHSITELKQIILNLKAILESNDISLIATYKSRNNEFRRLPPKVRVILPSSSPQKINIDQLRQMFGSLSPSSIYTEEHGELMKSPEAISSSAVKPMKSAEAVSSPPVKPMKSPEAVSSPPLLNLQSKLLTSIQTESGEQPRDIAVTRDGDLIYTNCCNVNLVKNKQIQTMITAEEWRPINFYSTSSDDLLVIMISDDKTQSKVVRYSTFTETQSIQFDDQGRPLYSSGYNEKYIS
ncbi:uncharacterized protein LOC130048684 [Ostrea edulis]|uniref:uncharacterized protein LOC130048684 n=1 Tax=Ostrea edulis TaxID=37623 RepID=UPI0024AF3B8D|nr:uncharacterized protein LOC130048684 [Ostrea edulis]